MSSLSHVSFYRLKNFIIKTKKDYTDEDVQHLFSAEYSIEPIFPTFNPRKREPSLLKWPLFKDLLSLLARNPDDRPDLRVPLNKLYFTAFRAPIFGLNRYVT